MKKILVPVDFSKPSEYAAKMAAKIAEKTNATVYLIHFIELPSGIIDVGASSRFSIPESMLYLRKTKDKIVAFKKIFFSEEITVEYFIKISNPFEGIKKYAQKIDADLIIMGSKGHSTFDDIIIGSNTEKVVRSSKIPVIILKTNPKKFKLKNLVFASNFKKENQEAFGKFLNFANAFQSKVHLLQINTPSQFENTADSKQKIKNFIEKYDLPKFSINIYNDNSVEKGILNFSRERKVDLIALSTHGRSGISHLFVGSVAKNLSKKALKPMFTVKV
ncbi:MAG: universal stress protein [Polaribacter sp.]|jgi:nucleotide-binding universal stress UspA family protein|tara:strand:+ start:1908 stop:2735 length:828 start_codon:yes stop_codon:yes gene_type:complete